MPTRVIRNITSANGTSKVKIGAPNSLVIGQDACYSQMMYRPSHRAAQYFTHVHIKFDQVAGDGLQMTAFMLKDQKEIIHTHAPTFRVYGVNLANWSQTLLITKAGMDVIEQFNGQFTTYVTPAEITTAFELDGEATFLIEVDLYRYNKLYTFRKYFNHEGIYDFVFKLKQRVDFMEVNKLDDGDSII